MYHIRMEIIEQRIELPMYLPRAKRSHQCLNHARSEFEFHLRRKILAPLSFQIFRVVHSKHCHFVTVRFEQLLQVECMDTVTTPAVIELDRKSVV